MNLQREGRNGLNAAMNRWMMPVLVLVVKQNLLEL